jgi:hypothetical protein
MDTDMWSHKDVAAFDNIEQEWISVVETTCSKPDVTEPSGKTATDRGDDVGEQVRLLHRMLAQVTQALGFKKSYMKPRDDIPELLAVDIIRGSAKQTSSNHTIQPNRTMIDFAPLSPSSVVDRQM